MPARIKFLSLVVWILPLVLLAGCGGGSGSSSSSSSNPGDEAGRDAEPPTNQAVAVKQPLTGEVAYPSQQPWPAFAANGLHSGAAAVSGPQTSRARWERVLEGPVVPGPAVGKGNIVFAASNGGVLHAIELKTGEDIWTFDGGGTYGSDLSTVPAVLPDGGVLWPGPEDTLFALDSGGRLEWKKRFGGQPLSPLPLDDGTIVVADQSGTLANLQPQAHGAPTTVWQLDLGAYSYGSPAVGADGTVYETTEEALIAVRDGEVLWKLPASSMSEVSPAVGPEGTIIFGTNDSEYGVSPDGEELWRHRNDTRTYSSPVVTRDGLLYYGDNRGFVTILEAETGDLIGRVGYVNRSGVWTAPAVDARHDVYFGTSPGHILGYDAKGKQLFDLETGAGVDSYPALASDGTLLIGSENGRLYALK